MLTPPRQGGSRETLQDLVYVERRVISLERRTQHLKALDRLESYEATSD